MVSFDEGIGTGKPPTNQMKLQEKKAKLLKPIASSLLNKIKEGVDTDSRLILLQNTIA